MAVMDSHRRHGILIWLVAVHVVSGVALCGLSQEVTVEPLLTTLCVLLTVQANLLVLSIVLVREVALPKKMALVLASVALALCEINAVFPAVRLATLLISSSAFLMLAFASVLYKKRFTICVVTRQRLTELPTAKMQFSLREIFISTTCIACLLATTRLGASEPETRIIYAVYMVAATILVAWITLGIINRVLRWLMSPAIVLLVVVASSSSLKGTALFAITLNMLFTVITLTVVRYCGYRLVQLDAPATNESAAAS